MFIKEHHTNKKKINLVSWIYNLPSSTILLASPDTHNLSR
jgi:hypothetical protein